MKTPAEGLIIAGKYALERELGRGGMGSVWVARDRALERRVAVKFLSPSLSQSAAAIARFEREAKAAARIASPHVVQIHDFGVDDGTPYIVMELLRGEDLAARLEARGRLSLGETAALIARIARALEVVHKENIVHRDLKPSNVFLADQGGEEILKLLDFGIAKALSAEGTPDASTTGALVGTVYYMSPEQVRLQKVDHRSDLWSLGVIVFQALTGQMPFSGEAAFDVLEKVCRGPVPRATQVVPGLPPAIDRFFERAWQQDPARRHASATEMAAELSAIASQVAPFSGPGAPSPGPGAPPRVPTEVMTPLPVTSPGALNTGSPRQAVQLPGSFGPAERPAGVPARGRLLWIVGGVVLALAGIPVAIALLPDGPGPGPGPDGGPATSSAGPRPGASQLPGSTGETGVRCRLAPWDGKSRGWAKLGTPMCDKPGTTVAYYLRVSFNQDEPTSRAAVKQAWSKYVRGYLGNAPCPDAQEMMFFDQKQQAGAGILFRSRPPGWDRVAAEKPEWLLLDAGEQPVSAEVCFFLAEESRKPEGW